MSHRPSFATIIITHYAMNDFRSGLLRKSLDSLFLSTEYPYQLIVVDNGRNISDSRYLLDLVNGGKITNYIRNNRNLSFGFARNQALSMALGDYIAICDNDILYKKDWLSESIEVLNAHPDRRIYTTHLYYPMSTLNKRYHRGYLYYKNWEMELHERAGSNCFVARRNDFFDIGMFSYHRVAGSHWVNAAIRKGYLACVIPTFKTEDMGLRQGYDLKEDMPIMMSLGNGMDLYFNQDEYRDKHPELYFYDQKLV